MTTTTATVSNSNRWHYHTLTGIFPEEAAGLVQLRRNRQSYTLVGVYNAVEAGMEEYGWATVCEEHGTLVVHDTRALATSWAAEPETWCEHCLANRLAMPARPKEMT